MEKQCQNVTKDNHGGDLDMVIWTELNDIQVFICKQ